MKKGYNITHILIALIIAVFTINYAVNSFSYLKKTTSTIEQIGQSELSEIDANLKFSLIKFAHFGTSVCSFIPFFLEKRLNEKMGCFYKSINSPHAFHLPVYLDNSTLLI